AKRRSNLESPQVDLVLHTAPPLSAVRFLQRDEDTLRQWPSCFFPSPGTVAPCPAWTASRATAHALSGGVGYSCAPVLIYPAENRGFVEEDATANAADASLESVCVRVKDHVA